MRTTVVNIRHCPPDWDLDPRYVYVGRPGRGFRSKWGNPHKVGKLCPACHRVHARGEAVKAHAEEVRERYRRDSVYRAEMEELRGKYCVCFCKQPDVEVPCHADVYVELLEGSP